MNAGKYARGGFDMILHVACVQARLSSHVCSVVTTTVVWAGQHFPLNLTRTCPDRDASTCHLWE